MRHPGILVVNDYPALREYFSFSLGIRGYAVKDIMGSTEVLSVIETEQPDLVILDVNLRRLDGFALCRKICESPVRSVIVFNMRGSENDLLQCLEMGVDDYIGRPLGVTELLARVRAALRHRYPVKQPVSNKVKGE